MGVELERHPEIGERIRARFGARARRMPENNLRQADVPAGASTIAQMPGTAPGLVCPVGEQVIYAVPGVPYELREMFDGTIRADLRRRAGLRSVIKSRVLRTWGESESGLAETLADRIAELDRLGNPTLAFLASGIEGIKVRITAKAGDGDAAENLARTRGGAAGASVSAGSCSQSTTTTWSPRLSRCSRPAVSAWPSPKPRPAV